jgi:DNA-binding response OmpR family regulator
MRVLVVEDDPTVSEIIAIAFEMRWPQAEVIRTSSGKEAVARVGSENPDLVVLDLGLPDEDGFDVLAQIRLFSQIPIIILTARNEESDIIRGLERGADDYITKPFRQLELMSRAQSILRRCHVTSQSLPSYGLIRFGQSLRELYIGDRKVILTNTESALMHYLISNGGKIVSLSNIGQVIWGTDFAGSHDAIRVYITRLRNKIEKNPKKPVYIITHPGTGYSLEI